MQPNVPFDKRLKQIERRHGKMTRGVKRSVNADGLIVARPRAYRPRFPLRGLIVVLAIGFMFKGFLFAYLGETAYAERVAVLQSGTAMEKAGAWLMQPDPATLLIGATDGFSGAGIAGWAASWQAKAKPRPIGRGFGVSGVT